MKDGPPKDRGAVQEDRTAVFEVFKDAYKKGNEWYPQTAFGSNVFVGSEVVGAILLGETTWRDFANSHLSYDQATNVAQSAEYYHDIYDIKETYRAYVDNSRIDKLWRVTKKDVIFSAYNFVCAVENEEPSDRVEVGDEHLDKLTDFFESEKSRDSAVLLAALLLGASEVLETRDARKVGRELRNSFRPEFAHVVSPERRNELVGRLAGMVRLDMEKTVQAAEILDEELPEFAISSLVLSLSPRIAVQKLKDS